MSVYWSSPNDDEGSSMYLVTKRFTDGALKGLVVRETTAVAFEVGAVVAPGAWTGPGYVVEAVEKEA